MDKEMEGLRDTLRLQYELLKALPVAQQAAALDVMREELRNAEQAGYEGMTPEEIAGVESLKRKTPSFPEAVAGFLRGCLNGTLSFDDFDRWFATFVHPARE